MKLRWRIVPLVLSVVLLAGLCSGARPILAQGEPSTDELVIVIAPFVPLAEQADPTAELMAALDQLASEIDQVRIVALEEPIPLLAAGCNPGVALPLSETYQAAVVIYGGVTPDGLTACYEITAQSWADGEILAHTDASGDLAFVRAYTRGHVYLLAQAYEEAIRAFSAAAEADPTRLADPANVGLFFYRGFAYFTLKDYPHAVADYDAALDLAPRQAEFYYNRAMAHAEMGNTAQALADFTTTIELNPQDALAYGNRGTVYSYLGDLTAALTDLTTAIDLAPQTGTFYNNRGTVYADMGRYAEAVTDFDAALRVGFETAGVYENRGNAYNHLEEHKLAIADYTAALRLDPEDIHVYHQRGMIYTLLGTYNLAIADFDAALRIAPEYAAAYLGRGLAYYLSGDEAHAIPDYRVYLDLAGADANPNVVTLLNMLEAQQAEPAAALPAQPTMQLHSGKP